MNIEAEDAYNEVEIWIDRTIAAYREPMRKTSDLSYLSGVEDGLLMVKGAVKKMKEELA